MARHLSLRIKEQPTDSSCGPTCLHALYLYYGDSITLEQVVAQTGKLENGGTLAVLLAIHALKRGYKADIYSYNLKLFDPSWFDLDRDEIIWKLRSQMKAKPKPKFQFACKSAIEYLELGGNFHFEELNVKLIRRLLRKRNPILTGLSSTYLYKTTRELDDGTPDDIAGDPVGHFVVLNGYNQKTRLISVADPLLTNPHKMQFYDVPAQHLLNSILLGIVTYDSNLLLIKPK